MGSAPKIKPGDWRLQEGDAVNHVGEDFDEIVVGKWLHVEEMDVRQWWAQVGGLTLWIEVRKDGTAKRVTITESDDTVRWPGE